MPTAIRGILLIMGVALGAPAVAQDECFNTPFGFSASKPADWHYLTAEPFQDNVKARDLYPDLNPSVSVNIREARVCRPLRPCRRSLRHLRAF